MSGRVRFGHGPKVEPGAVFDWLKSLAMITCIQATCDIENIASIRVLEKLGLSQTSRLRDHESASRCDRAGNLHDF